MFHLLETQNIIKFYLIIFSITVAPHIDIYRPTLDLATGYFLVEHPQHWHIVACFPLGCRPNGKCSPTASRSISNSLIMMENIVAGGKIAQ